MPKGYTAFQGDCCTPGSGIPKGATVKEIQLADGRVSLVDDDDFERLNARGWWVATGRGIPYAVFRENGKLIYMHHVVLRSKQMIDHKNGNSLDNRKENLRFCTPSQNQANSKIRKDNTTGFRGIQLRKDSGKFRVRLQVRTRRFTVGHFESIEDAKDAHRKAYLEHFGEFARI